MLPLSSHSETGGICAMDDLLKKMRALEERVHQLEEEKASSMEPPWNYAITQIV